VPKRVLEQVNVHDSTDKTVNRRNLEENLVTRSLDLCLFYDGRILEGHVVGNNLINYENFLNLEALAPLSPVSFFLIFCLCWLLPSRTSLYLGILFYQTPSKFVLILPAHRNC